MQVFHETLLKLKKKVPTGKIHQQLTLSIKINSYYYLIFYYSYILAEVRKYYWKSVHSVLI